MKTRILYFVLMMLGLSQINAQTIMNIHLNDGDVIEIPLNTIDSITYTVIATVDLATVSTVPTDNITSTSAASGGNVSDDGGSPVTQRGICWSTNPNPTTANSLTNDGSGTGNFNSNLTGLTDLTIYYLRAYAINSAGTAYGDELSFIATDDIVPTCDDGYQNQLEFGVDCGGPFCPPCELYLYAESLNGFPFTGSNITVTLEGLIVIISGTQELAGQIRTLTLRLPINLMEDGVAAITQWPGVPSASYNEFGTGYSAVSGTGACWYAVHTMAQLIGSRRIEGGIDSMIMMNSFTPVEVYGVEFGVNY